MLSQLVIVESVRFLRTGLVRTQVVPVDEEANDGVDECVDEDEGENDEPPVWHDMLVVRLHADLIK